MKKIIFVILFVVFSFSIIEPALAHPGRTDRYGGHTCRTNCKKWGLKYGQYHKHYRWR